MPSSRLFDEKATKGEFIRLVLLDLTLSIDPINENYYHHKPENPRVLPAMYLCFDQCPCELASANIDP